MNILKVSWLAFISIIVIYTTYKIIHISQNRKISKIVVYSNSKLPVCNHLKIQIEEHLKNSENKIIGTKFIDLDYINISKIIKKANTIKNIYLFRTGLNQLSIEFVPKKIICRVIGYENKNRYLDENGNLLTVKYIVPIRCPILCLYNYETKYIDYMNMQQQNKNSIQFKKIIKTNHKLFLKKNLSCYEKQLLFFLKTINKDTFFSKQITFISLNEHKDIFVKTQISSQIIKFGQPNSINKKLKKLRLFYNKIVPNVGWQKYKEVNLSYEGQIVCK